jgi:diguanylate cyclase (GGDEF)-like protein
MQFIKGLLLEDIKKITKDVLTTLKNQHLNITPENYFKEFRNQAKINNINIEELKLFDELLETLTEEEKKSFYELETFSDLSILLSRRVSDEKIKDLIIIFDEILSPSVNFDIKDEIELTVQAISKEPKKLFDKNTINTLKNITQKRITEDRVILRKKTDDIIKISTLMGKYFDKSLLESANSTNEISNIKNELEDLNISDSSQRELSFLQTKLVDTIYNIENSMLKNNEELNQNKNSFAHLHETISKLQEELSLAKEERSTDFLTNVLNRKAYHKEIEKIEKKHDIFDTNYAIIFYDIDHFKKINDSYGHTCGDHILKTFGGIIKNLTRQGDIIARYGGEEFIALVNYKNEVEVINYVKRVKKLIKNNFFVFKDIKIQIKFSAGVTFRNKYDSYMQAKKRADELLYQAKQLGRDKIIVDEGTII